MTTQLVEFGAPPNQTLTVRLFAAGSDTIVQTASAVTAATNRAGLYTATFTSVAAGTYRLIATNAAGTPLATWWVDLTLTAATFPAYEMPMSLVQTVTTNNDKTGYTLTVTPPTVTQIVTGVYAALPADHTVAGSYGARFVLAFNSNRQLQLTGSHHAAADVHEFQPDVITEAAIADNAITAAQISADAVTEIQTGLATLANQNAIIGYIDTEITAIKAVTEKLNTGLVQDGAVYQFTANMLELAPAGGGGGGGGGDATEANQELILDQLDLIQAKTDLIGNAAALIAVASLQPGTITSFPETLRAGDSYTTENGRAITVQLLDTNGDPIEQSGSLLFTNAVVEFKIRRSGETDSSRIIVGTADVTNPAGTGANQGPYVTIQLASEETAKGLVKYRYTGLLTFTWPGTSDEVVSFETGTVTFNN